VTLFSVVLGLSSIALGSKESDFVSELEGLLSSGRSGIALVEVRGSIVDGYASGGGSVGADYIRGLLREARENDSIKAVLLYINSPGGTVGGTKKIYDAVMRVRSKKKPVVAVIGGIAASGGYYIASAADKILAQRGSLIGSIGVISLRFNIAGFLKTHGIGVTVIKSGRYKDMSYPFRAMTGEELAMRNRVQRAAYEQFILDVAEGRKKSPNFVRANWADARIFSGEEADREKMIDDLGGREKAREVVRDILKMSRKLPILAPRRGFLQNFLEGLSASHRVQARVPENEVMRRLLSAPALYYYTGAPLFGLDFARGLGFPSARRFGR